MLTTEWKKSIRSGAAGHCVQARLAEDGGVQVRDSKNPDAGVLTFTPDEWNAFTGGTRDGEFDIPA